MGRGSLLLERVQRQLSRIAQSIYFPVWGILRGTFELVLSAAPSWNLITTSTVAISESEPLHWLTLNRPGERRLLCKSTKAQKTKNTRRL